MRLRIPLAVLTLAAFTVACNGDAPTALNTDSTLLAPTALSSQSTAAEVFEFDGTIVPGASSKITRTANGANSVLHTSGLIKGNAYTMWMVVFNVPGECTSPCGEDDVVPGTLAMVDVIYVAGNVAGGSGKATFSGRRAAGDNSKSLFAAAFGAPALGLIDPLTAEMHLIVRDHGPKVPGQVSSQIHTFEGACTPKTSFDLGDGGNDCEDIQFSIHLP